MRLSISESERMKLGQGQEAQGKIMPGVYFSTEVEEGCEVTGTPDAWGNFLALDHEGVECQFNYGMVTETYADRRTGRLLPA